MAMLNQSANPIVTRSPVIPRVPATDRLGILAGQAKLIESEFSYRRDEAIYGEEEPAEYVYQVVSGAVRTYKLLSDGRRQIAAFHLPGDIFGLVSENVHRLTAEAIVDTTVRLVKRRALEQAADTDVNVARHLWAMTASDLRRAEDQMLLLGRKTALERVAAFLLEMDRRLAVTGAMALPMCRRDIADYLGLTLETVSRAFSQFQNDGVLDLSGARQITLRNRSKLHTIDS
jgi:CRP/FNR family transcriptional regulator, nitrogen fixation regulation protein